LTEKEHMRLEKLKEIDISIFEKDIQFLAGIDEAGRGPLAGPVVVGCVILPRDSYIEGVNDSKKISENKREKIFEQIKNEAIAWSVGIIEQEEIDRINILNATKNAVTMAINEINPKPNHILVDALNNIDTLGLPHTSIIKGDAISYSIGAASIIAKVTRDRIMREYDNKYPEYGFAKHKGYGTKFHMEKLKEIGPCDIHRKSFLSFLNN
jgi:ribonuclease HII